MSHSQHQSEMEKLRRAMEKELSSGRYAHTLGVAYTAASLADRKSTRLNSSHMA